MNLKENILAIILVLGSCTTPVVVRANSIFKQQSSAPILRSADNLTEALLFFRDPFTGDPMVPGLGIVLEKGANGRLTPKARCFDDKRCLGCLQSLSAILSRQSENPTVVKEFWLLTSDLELETRDLTQHCPWKRDELEPDEMCTPKFAKDKGIGNLMKSIMETDRVTCYRSNRRKKKEVPLSGPGIAESRKDEQEHAPLCSTCWSMEILDRDMKPSILNQLACKEHEEACLKGNGMCCQQYGSRDITLQDEHKRITIKTGCLCGLKYVSPLGSLVKRN